MGALGGNARICAYDMPMNAANASPIAVPRGYCETSAYDIPITCRRTASWASGETYGAGAARGGA